MYDPYADFTVHALSNGVPVYVLYLPERSFVWTEMVFQVGMRDELSVPCGTAHFLEHMVCANSGMTLMEIKRFFGAVGGAFDAFTGFESTRYGFMTPVMGDEIDVALSFWTNACLVNSLDMHFDREMTIINSEIKKRYPNTTTMNLADKISVLHYRGLPWSGAPSAAGTLTSLSRITPDSVKQFRRHFYPTQNLSVVCVGGMSPQALLAKLEKTAVGQKTTGERNTLPLAISNFPILVENDIELSLTQGEQMGQASLEYKALLPFSVSCEAAFIAADMITELLYTEVREKRGLAYSVGAGVSTRGPFHDFFASVSNAPVSKVGEVRQVVAEIFHSFADNQQLFAEIKKKRIANFYTRDATLKGIKDNAVRDLALFGRIISYQEEMTLVKAVTLADVVKVMQCLTVPDEVLRITVYK